MLQWLSEMDTKALLCLNGKHSPDWDTVMFWISGKESWVPFYVFLLIIIIYRERPYRFIFTILFVVIAATLSDQISVLIKDHLVQRFRPSHNPEIKNLLHFVNDYRGGPYGFVSSHAANVFGLAAFLSNQFKSYKWSLLLFFWAAVVSYSRIYLGVHYPLDIICGALLGALIGIQCYVFRVRTAIRVERYFEIRKEKKADAMRRKNHQTRSTTP